MNEIIKEIRLMKSLVGDNHIPKPTYMYIQAYGKDIREDMEELATELGYRQYAVFDRMSCSQGKKYVDAYNILMEKKKPLGQSYEGCILIDLTGMDELEDIIDFISYIGMQKDTCSYIFTMNETKNTGLIQEVLEQYFFVRKIVASKYSLDEQCKTIEEELQKYIASNINISFGEGIRELLLQHLEQCKWKTMDMVKHKLKNMVAKAVYDAIVLNESTDIVVDGEFIADMFEGQNVRAEEKSTFGFCIGG